MKHAYIATIQEISDCCKLIPMLVCECLIPTGFLHTSQYCSTLLAHSFAFL